MDFNNSKEGPVIEIVRLKPKRDWPKYAAILTAVVLLAAGFYSIENSESDVAKAFRAAIIATFKGPTNSGELVEAIDVNSGSNKQAEADAVKLTTIYIPTEDEAAGIIPEVAPSIVIDEIMYDLPGLDSGREWVEIKNTGEAGFNLSELSFYENKTNHKLKVVRGSDKLIPGGLAIVADNPDEFLKDNPTYQGVLFDSTFSLDNDGEAIALKSGDKIINQAIFSSKDGASGDGNSLQSINGVWITQVPTPGK